MRDEPRAPRTPTLGQRTQLERISTDGWVLIGEQSTAGAPIIYRLVERGTGREIHPLTAAMVRSLVSAGWLELAPGPPPPGRVTRWAYRVTQAGIAARDRGWQAHEGDASENQRGNEQP